MNNKEMLDYIEQNNIQNHEKENKDALNAARWAFISLVIVEFVFIGVKLYLNQNTTENFGAMFLTFGVFNLVYNKYQPSKKSLINGIISLALGIVFSLGYIGMILG